MGKRKEGHRVVFIEAPEDLVERLKAVAKLNHRSMTGELVAAMERHVEAEEAARSGAGAGPAPKKGTKGRTGR